jgi:transglutaminase-like putative cysteine protease
VAVRHTTTSRYAGEVFASYNEARLTPKHDAGQVVVDARVDVSPSVPVHRHEDYWDNVVHTFEVHAPHSELTVVGSAVVDTMPMARATGVSWADLDDPDRHDEFYEFLASTDMAAVDDALDAVASELKGAAATPEDAVRETIACAREHLAYERGHTTITTSAAEAWGQGSGVCQDFAHVSLALLRAMGVPARYVSGYLHPEPDAPVGEVVTGESHAWIEAWLGEWAPFDPTNGQPVDCRHVVVARGRDYVDVAPMRGVFTGAAATGQDVTVEVTRLA